MRGIFLQTEEHSSSQEWICSVDLCSFTTVGVTTTYSHNLYLWSIHLLVRKMATVYTQELSSLK